jgi:hypothetical protein
MCEYKNIVTKMDDNDLKKTSARTLDNFFFSKNVICKKKIK